MAGEPARVTLCAVAEPVGVFSTVNAPLARLSAAARSSPKVTASAVPVTSAEATAGAVLSTS